MSERRYRVVVEGELGSRYESAFDGMTISTGGGRTEITGPIIDSSHLHGLLERIAGLGLTVHSLTPLGAESAGSGAPPHTSAGVNEHGPGANSNGTVST
jgi:hypothetical protein